MKFPSIVGILTPPAFAILIQTTRSQPSHRKSGSPMLGKPYLVFFIRFDRSWVFVVAFHPKISFELFPVRKLYLRSWGGGTSVREFFLVCFSEMFFSLFSLFPSLPKEKRMGTVGWMCPRNKGPGGLCSPLGYHQNGLDPSRSAPRPAGGRKNAVGDEC